MTNTTSVKPSITQQVVAAYTAISSMVAVGRMHDLTNTLICTQMMPFIENVLRPQVPDMTLDELVKILAELSTRPEINVDSIVADVKAKLAMAPKDELGRPRWQLVLGISLAVVAVGAIGYGAWLFFGRETNEVVTSV